jgi:Na+-translocating ferredoxin:NAD+ oxidoreductase subunit E
MTSAIQDRDAILLLAMCPLLAVSDTAVNAIGMAALVLIAAPLTAGLFMATRRLLAEDAQLAGVLLVFAGVIACCEILLRAWFFDLHEALGVFTPLIIANLVIVGALIARDEDRGGALGTVLRASVVIAVMLLILGCARELVGRGSLLHDAGLMFGVWARTLETNVFRVDMGFLLGMLPPGAFISLGLLLALRNWIGRGKV